MTLIELRAHYKVGDNISEVALRAMAAADDIEVTEDAHASDPPDFGKAIGELSEVARSLTEKVEGLTDQQETDREEQRANAANAAEALLSKLKGGELNTPSMTEGARAPAVSFNDPLNADYGYNVVPAGIENTAENRANARRSNLEIAMMMFEGSWKTKRPSRAVPSEALFRAWQHEVFESSPDTIPVLADAEGSPIRSLSPQSYEDFTRAMDSAESGFGADLIGVQYVRDMWEAARNLDGVVGSIREIPMSDPTTTIPVDGDLPEMLFVGESTGAGATAYSTSKTASSSVSIAAKKFTIQQVWSGELNEDSIVPFAPFLRERLNMSAALYKGSTYLNGDATTGSTGNINKDDGTPGSTKHYLSYDGIRHYWLVDATGQGKSMAAELDPIEITRARGKLNSGDDDVDSLVKNINWGLDAGGLRAVMDWDTYLSVIDLDIVKTVDQYGPQATVHTGELAKLPGGIPLISPSYAVKTQADGKQSDTESNNSLGQISIFNPSGWIAGRRRDQQLFFDRIQQTDQFLFELYVRGGFKRFGGNVSSGVYNITVA